MPSYRDFNKLTCKIVFTRSDGSTINLFEVNEASVEKSFDTLTNTAEIILPRDNRWINRDKNGFNTVHLVGSHQGKLIDDNEKSVLEVGDKVSVYLGYDFQNQLVFEGFITGMSPQSPFKLICEDAAWKLKQNKILYSSKKAVKLSEFAEVLLNGTGVEMHPQTSSEEIVFPKLRVNGQSAAQVLNQWKKDLGLISYIKDGQLIIGRTFFASEGDSFKTSGSEDYEPPIIHLDYQVPQGGDELELTTLSASQLALKATSTRTNNQSLSLTLALDPTDNSKLIILEENNTQWTSNQREQRQRELKRELEGLNVFPANYQTRSLNTYNLDREELLKTAKGYFSKYVSTGLEGRLTLFGDHNFEPATTVILLDRKNAEKAGEYLIQAVSHKFGQGGYRISLHIPDKVSKLEEEAEAA